MEHKCLPTFWMVLPNLLCMKILAKPHLALKLNRFVFYCFTSCPFWSQGRVWWMVSSGQCHPAHTWVLSSVFSFQRAKMSLWAHTWNYRLGYEQAEFSLWKEQFHMGRNSGQGGGLCCLWVWGRTGKSPPGLAGTALQHSVNIKGVTLTRALGRWRASDKHWSKLESFAVLWCYQLICRNHLIYGKCHI